MQVFDEAQTRAALPFGALIARLRDMFRAGCTVPARHVHAVGTGAASGTVLIMPAWTDRYLGIKVVNVYPENGTRGLPGLFSTYTLFDAATGEPLAQMDGNVITSRRTAAASALAASYLARKDAKCLAVLGAGRVGSLVPLAYSALFALERILVWDRTPLNARRVATALAAAGLPAVAADDRERAVREADIVSTATLSRTPIVEGAWLQPASHLDLIGSFTPEMREADDAALAAAAVFVDTDEALRKSGDLLMPMSSGALRAGDVQGTLADLCRGASVVRTSTSQRTVFKSVGTALEDLAAAIHVLEAR